MSVRSWIRDVQSDRIRPSALFRHMAKVLPSVWVPLAANDDGEDTPALAVKANGESWAVLFTDAEAAGVWADEFRTDELSAFDVLQEMVRSGFQGLIINPGNEEKLMMDSRNLHRLYREYVMTTLAADQPVWAPIRGGSLLAVEMDPGVMACPVYLTEADARGIILDELGAEFRLVTWATVWDRCLEIGADMALLQMGYRDQVAMHRQHIANFCGDGRQTPLDVVENILEKPESTARTGELVAALAMLDHIWVLMDDHENVLGKGEFLDLFTTSVYARVVADREQPSAPDHPNMRPHRFPAAALFGSVATKPPRIGINRGQEFSFEAGREVVSAVLAMMERTQIH